MYLMGDIHGDVQRIIDVINGDNCEEKNIIVLGDAGINYYLDQRDIELKKKLQDEIDNNNNKLINVFFLRGNHECRPEHICDYGCKHIYGGECYIEEEFPNLIFLKDGESYKIDNKNIIALGGGFSDDWFYRLLNDKIWVDQELSYQEYERAKEKLDNTGEIIVLSHMLPSSALSLFNINKEFCSDTETLLESILELYSSKIMEWYAGHYHKDIQVLKDNIKMNIIYKNVLRI